MRAVIVPGLAALGLLAGAGPAGASTAEVVVSVTEQPRGPAHREETVRVAGEGAEANVFETAFDGSSGVYVRDRGAALRAGSGCQAVDAETVRCSASGGIQLAAGEGDDRVAHTGARGLSGVRLEGGGGNDMLALDPAASPPGSLDGGPGDDLVLGGAQDDRLDGGGGTDTLRGGEGEDVLADADHEGTAGPDVLDGGGGLDSVSYAGRVNGVDVSLERERGNGEPGEDDALIAIEGDLQGGEGDDVLTGGPLGQEVDGQGGADRIDGRGGDDSVIAGAVNTGGDGDDTFAFMDERADISCDGGRDRVLAPGPRDLIRPGCERVAIAIGTTFSVVLRLPPSSLRRPLARLLGPCERGNARRCRATLSLRDDDGVQLGRERATARRGRRLSVPVRLSRRGRRAVESRGPLRLRLGIDILEPGNRVTSRTRHEEGFFILVAAP